MYHYRRNTIKLTTDFGKLAGTMLILTLMAVFGLGMSTANAASYTATRLQKNPRVVLKSDLSKMSGREEALLDWRTQEMTMLFDLPRHNWYEKLDLFLSVYPRGKVARSTPVEVRFNGGQPIPLYGQGGAFEAHITLDTGHIQLQDNRLTIRYKTPVGKGCLSADDGAWVVDLKRSRLVATTRPKKREMQIIELERRLGHAMAAPKRVRIIARGTQSFALEALSAQGIAARMKFVPDFKLGSALADMTFIIGTPKDIAPLVKNKALLYKNAPIVFMDRRVVPTVVMTAPDEVGVLRLVRAFASYHLPPVRRSAISISEFYTSPRLSPVKTVGAGTTPLAEIGNPAVSSSWRPEPADIRFNTKATARAGGVLTLKILSAKDINPASRISVSLNGRSLGYTDLDKSVKNVEFPLRASDLKPSDNHLLIKPALAAGKAANNCAARQYIPTILISGKSKLHLDPISGGPKADLANLSADGGPFAHDATIVLTARTRAGRAATLKFLGLAAQKIGPVWAHANYLNRLPTKGDGDNYLNTNLLIIGPNPLPDSALLATAPKAFRLAIGKKRLPPAQVNSAQTFGKFASANESQVIRLAAARARASRLAKGGIAAVFPSPYAPGRMVGIISAERPGSFVSAMKSLSTEGFWNGLEGSVVRWDRHKILMAQTALALPSDFTTAPQKAQKHRTFLSATSNWWSNLMARNESAHSGAAKPHKNQSTQTASLTPVGRTQMTSTAVKLRGSLPAQLQTRHSGGRSQSGHLSRFSRNSAVSDLRKGLHRLQLKTQRAVIGIRQWSARQFGAVWHGPKATKWRKTFIHNPALFFGSLIFLAFFLIALTSPLRARLRPRRKRPASQYF